MKLAGGGTHRPALKVSENIQLGVVHKSLTRAKGCEGATDIQQESVGVGDISSAIVTVKPINSSLAPDNKMNDVKQCLAVARDLVTRLEREVAAKEIAEEERRELHALKVEKAEEQEVEAPFVGRADTLTETAETTEVDETGEINQVEGSSEEEDKDEEEEEEDELESSEETVTRLDARKGCLTCSTRRLACTWRAVDGGNGHACDTCRMAKIRCNVKGVLQRPKRTVKDKGKVPVVAPNAQEEPLRRSTRFYIGDPRRISGTPKRRLESSEANPNKRARRTTEEWMVKETRELRWECKDMLNEMRRSQAVYGEALKHHGRVLEALLRHLGASEDD